MLLVEEVNNEDNPDFDNNNYVDNDNKDLNEPYYIFTCSGREICHPKYLIQEHSGFQVQKGRRLKTSSKCIHKCSEKIMSSSYYTKLYLESPQYFISKGKRKIKESLEKMDYNVKFLS